MADLFLHGNQVATVFDLLGWRENDLTYSLGWGLANSEHLVRSLLKLWHPQVRRIGDIEDIRLQERHPDCGITDIEIWTDKTATIIEAKRGWNLPSHDQLERYASCLKYRRRDRAIVALTACTDDYALRHLPRRIGTIPVLHTCWADIRWAVADAMQSGSHREKHLLRELDAYLGGLVSMQDQDSNWVYVVSLGRGGMEAVDLDWIEVVERYSLYFHPYGVCGWPKEPPNYLGFRYNGHLQRVCHVESAEIIDNLYATLNRLTGRATRRTQSTGEYVLYRLGPPIVPVSPVKTGSIWGSGRVWAALDLLLTCQTVSEARDMSKARFQ